MATEKSVPYLYWESTSGHLVHVDGAGHLIRNDKAAIYEREVRAFLAALSL